MQTAVTIRRTVRGGDARRTAAGYAAAGPALTPVRAGARMDGIGGVEADWATEIARVRDHGDQQAFARLFRHFAPRIKAFLIRSGSSPEFAEDCAQDVMAQIWRKAHLFEPSRASAATWIFTIARNRRIDMVRRERRPEPEDLPWGPEAEAPPAEAVALRQEEARLAEAIRALPEAQRRMVERAYFADLSHSEIAAETGLPLGTIKSRLRLALARLREAMA
jgi:RNA polymerase sigma-70 factor (ECF subfamily)